MAGLYNNLDPERGLFWRTRTVHRTGYASGTVKGVSTGPVYAHACQGPGRQEPARPALVNRKARRPPSSIGVPVGSAPTAFTFLLSPQPPPTCLRCLEALLPPTLSSQVPAHETPRTSANPSSHLFFSLKKKKRSGSGSYFKRQVPRRCDFGLNPEFSRSDRGWGLDTPKPSRRQLLLIAVIIVPSAWWVQDDEWPRRPDGSASC